jgi:hypothetical protein
MEDKIIILIVGLVAIAGVGGYFVGLYQGSGNFSLNVNNSTGNLSNSTATVPKTTTTTNGSVTPVKNTTKKNSTGNNSTS